MRTWGDLYSDLRVIPDKIAPNESAKVTVDVTNAGKHVGDEVVQLYLHDVVGSVARPVKELKGFQRVSLAVNETKTVVFVVTPEQLSMFDKRMKWGVEPGIFELQIGSSSADIRLRAEIEGVNK